MSDSLSIEEPVALVTLSLQQPGDKSVLYRTWQIAPADAAEIEAFCDDVQEAS